MPELILGLCNICKKTPIFKKVGNSWVATLDYAEVTFVLSDDSVARHGICADCGQHLTDQKLIALYEDVRSYMRDQMVGTATKEQFEQLDSIKVLGWHKDFEKAIELSKVIKVTMHKDKIEKSHLKDKKGKNATD